VSASLTYFDSFNKSLVLYSYKALTVWHGFYTALQRINPLYYIIPVLYIILLLSIVYKLPSLCEIKGESEKQL